MQTVIQVVTTGRGSLRNKIMSDPQLEKKVQAGPDRTLSAPAGRTAGPRSTAPAKRTVSSTWNGTAGPAF
jgi:hypothetical protein